MSETIRPVPTYIGPDGKPTAHVVMTPTSDKVDVEVNAPPEHAIPIVFVPGVMGSPLLATGENAEVIGDGNRWAWLPDDKGWMLISDASYSSLSPAKRKKLLDPENTRALRNPEDADRAEVAKHTRALLEIDTALKAQKDAQQIPQELNVEEALNRGWGSVSLDSYAEILNYLDTQLRFIVTSQGKPYPGTWAALPRDGSAWGQSKGYTPLDTEALKKAAEFHYPVYAVGYNWLQSSGQSADYLAERIRAILARCEKTLHVKCRHGVILVTHSMGGLVGRMCAKRYPQLIQGVVHSVQPAIGSATAYHRIRAGWEWQARLNPMATVSALGGAHALGGSGDKLMPVFANAAGPLELLPTARYGAGWLCVVCNGKELFHLPTPTRNGIDPYAQIYLEPRAWWRLMDPAWINPPDPDAPRGTLPPSILSVWNDYKKQILRARDFHAELGDYYHPNTYVHYGADKDYKSFHRVTWTLKPGLVAPPHPDQPGTPGPAPSRDQALGLRLVRDNYEGTVLLRNEQGEQTWINQHGVARVHDTRGDNYVAELQDQDEAGDGTVPVHSAQDAGEHAVFAVRMTGYDHQGSYKDTHVKHATLYAVLRMGANAKELPCA